MLISIFHLTCTLHGGRLWSVNFSYRMASCRDNYLFKDDIDAVLAIADSDFMENKELHSEFDQVVEKIATLLPHTCLLSDKACLSKGGLTRHLKSKNPQSQTIDTNIEREKDPEEVLHRDRFRTMLIQRASKVAARKCYPY